MKDPDPGVVEAAVGAVVALGADAIEPLIAALSDAEHRIRAASAWALGYIAEDLNDTALRWRTLEMLIASLRDDHPYVREAAANGLGRSGSGQALKPLRGAVGDAHDEVRAAALSALTRIVIHQWDVSLRKQIIGHLVSALDDVSASVRVVALRSLGQLGAQLRDVEMLGQVVKVVCRMLSSSDSRLRLTATTALGYIGDPYAIEPLFSLIAQGDAEEALVGAARAAIVQIGSPAVPSLVRALTEHDASVRQRAAELLDELGWEPVTQELRAARCVARLEWEECIQIGEPAVEALLRELISPVPEHRVRAMESLVAIGHPAADGLQSLLLEGRPAERIAAVEVLDQVGWEPLEDEYACAYWVVKRRWDRCVEIGAPSIPFVLAAMWEEWDYDAAADAARTLSHLGWRPGDNRDAVLYYLLSQRTIDCLAMGERAVNPLLELARDRRDERLLQSASDALLKLYRSGELSDDSAQQIAEAFHLPSRQRRLVLNDQRAPTSAEGDLAQDPNA